MTKNLLVIPIALVFVTCFLVYTSHLYHEEHKKVLELEAKIVVDEQPHKSKVNDYAIIFSGDLHAAKNINAEVELHGGSPSLNKGVKVSVPSEFHFQGTELKFSLKEDREGSQHYVLAQLYKNGTLVYEQDNATLFRDITLIDLNIGRSND